MREVKVWQWKGNEEIPGGPAPARAGNEPETPCCGVVIAPGTEASGEKKSVHF
jgi:hypothetical protein